MPELEQTGALRQGPGGVAVSCATGCHTTTKVWASLSTPAGESAAFLAYAKDGLREDGWRYAACKGWLCPECARDFERELRARFPMAHCQEADA